MPPQIDVTIKEGEIITVKSKYSIICHVGPQTGNGINTGLYNVIILRNNRQTPRPGSRSLKPKPDQPLIAITYENPFTKHDDKLSPVQKQLRVFSIPNRQFILTTIGDSITVQQQITERDIQVIINFLEKATEENYRQVQESIEHSPKKDADETRETIKELLT